VERAFADTARGDGRAFVDMLADDATWRIIGNTAWSRTYAGKAEILTNLLAPLRANFAVPNRVTARRIRAADDWVVVEARGQTETKAGTPYCNEYCWIIEMKDGKAREIVEYADTALIDAVLRYPS
jgi:uncharacterized protein